MSSWLRRATWAATWCPASSTVPPLGATSPSSVRANVVLPLPDSPTSPSVSPGQIDAETPASACTSCPCARKTFVSSSTRRSGVADRSTVSGRSRSAAVSRGSCWARSWKWQRLEWPPPRSIAAGSSVEHTRLGERAAVGEDAAGRPLADRAAGSRGSCRAGRGPCGRPSGGCSAAGRPCTGAAGRASTVSTGALLDEPARVEHADAVAHLPDHAEVVADEEHRRPELGAQLGDQVEHLGLDGRVEPGRRLVEDQERGILRERHRDHDALLHPAGELVRVPLHHRRRVGDLHLRERVLDARPAPRRAPRRGSGTPPRPAGRPGSTGSAPGAGFW